VNGRWRRSGKKDGFQKQTSKGHSKSRIDQEQTFFMIKVFANGSAKNGVCGSDGMMDALGHNSGSRNSGSGRKLIYAKTAGKPNLTPSRPSIGAFRAQPLSKKNGDACAAALAVRNDPLWQTKPEKRLNQKVTLA